MPKIQWTDLPFNLRDHLMDRVRTREISLSELDRLRQWQESGPDAPEGEWWKDFGSFKLCGEGKYPKTFLLKGQSAKGKEIE